MKCTQAEHICADENTKQKDSRDYQSCCELADFAAPSHKHVSSDKNHFQHKNILQFAPSVGYYENNSSPILAISKNRWHFLMWHFLNLCFFQQLKEKVDSELLFDINELQIIQKVSAMSGNVHGLSWFPNIPDKFVTWGQDINLYEVRNKGEADVKPRLPNIPANFVAIENRYQYARCVQPSYHKHRPIIAVGLGDGKIGISNFHEMVDNSWEYTPRQQRMCLCLAWNETDPNILAIGHDRYKSDSCITIWDIERGLPKESSSNFFGLSESAHSLCWNKNHRVLIAGMNQKQIKLYDLRQNTSTLQTIQTKTVYGLGVAPNGNYLSSFFDSVIMLWDLHKYLPIKLVSDTIISVSSFSHDVNLNYITYTIIRCVDVEKVGKSVSGQETVTALTHSWPTATLKGRYCYQKLKLPLLLQRPLSAPSSPAHSNSQTASQSSSTLRICQYRFFEDLVDETRERALSDYGLKMDGKRLSGDSISFMNISRIETTCSAMAGFINNSNNLVCLQVKVTKYIGTETCGWPFEQDLDRFNTLQEYSPACDILSKAVINHRDPSNVCIAALPLIEEGVSLADRMAFACKYLSDSKLSDYIKKEALNGLLLTGESQMALILQSHMDSTEIFRLFALMCINYFHPIWICLNSWGFLGKACRIGNKIVNLRSTSRTARTVYLSCNFCGKSVSNALQDDAQHSFHHVPVVETTVVVLYVYLHMGTTLNGRFFQRRWSREYRLAIKTFSNMVFLVCQTCRSCGHTEHLMQWFKQILSVPVSSCTCRCFDMDVTNPEVTHDFHS
ncbi:WD repeat-containing protein mio [Lucilia cuprina]|nr:WD repeat-containing protein mio [Lucilia cuprina]